jgi:hypothetical protein
MFCLKNGIEHPLELSGFLNLVTAGEKIKKKVVSNDRAQAKQRSQPLQGLARTIHKS